MAATAMTSVTTDAPSSTSPTATTSPTSIPAPTLPISMPTTTSTTSSPSTAHLSLEERFPFLREQTGRRRSRQLLSPEQTNVLLGILRQTRFPSTAVREQAAKELGISPRKVQVFFQNKRQGLRKKMLNAAQDLVDLANSEDTSHDTPPAVSKTPAGAQLQVRERRAMTLGGGRLPARIASPAGASQSLSSTAAESRTYDAWRRGGAAADDDGMDVDGEESEDGSPDEGEEETHEDETTEPQTPTPARLAAMQARPLAVATATQQVGPASRQRAASDAAYLQQQRGASQTFPARPQHSPIQQQQRPQPPPYARPSPRSATLLPPLQVKPRNSHAGTTTTSGALTSSASPRRATFSFAATPTAARTMPAPTRALPLGAGMTNRSPVHAGTMTSPPGTVVLGLSNMAPRHPPQQHQHQHQARPHDAARHHQRSISLAAYPMMAGAGPALQHQHQHQHHMSSRVPLQPLAPQPQPVPRQQHQQQFSPLQPARPTSLRRHASYGHPDAQPPTAVTVASLPFMQWRSGSGDQSYASSAGVTMDGNGSMTMTTHPSSGSGSSDRDMVWTPSSTRDDGLASKDGRPQQHQVISPRHAHAVATPSRRAHAPLPHQWMQPVHVHALPQGQAPSRSRGLSVTRKPVCLAPILDLSLDVPLDVERLAVGSRSPENARKRLGEEADDGEVSMTLPPLRLGESLRRRREESLGGKRRRRGAQAKGDEEVASDEDDEADEDDAPLSKTCARETAQQQQPTPLPSVAELTRTLGLLPWTTTTKGRPVKQDVRREAAVAAATMSA